MFMEKANATSWVSLSSLSFANFTYLGLQEPGQDPDDVRRVAKVPKKLGIFHLGNAIPARQIRKVVCGGMHSVALATNGTVWTWGNNDDGALGRSGCEGMPLQVDASLNVPVEDISAGD